MYSSLYTLRSKVSSYQLTILLLLDLRCHLVTNEGRYFKVWMADRHGKKIKFTVRKDTGSNLLTLGLMRGLPELDRDRLHYYTISDMGRALLDIVDTPTFEKIQRNIEIIFEEKE